MGYQHKHIQIKTAKDWYNLVADQYHKHHAHLDSFDKWFFLRLLPRNLQDTTIIDLWAGDWRVFKFFKKHNFQSFTACDISEKLLKRHPSSPKIQKIICNLEEKLPFDDDKYDLATSFFVLEHIENLDFLFQELYRILKKWWQRIIWHFLQRREFVWKNDKDKFKIKIFNHRIQDIEKTAQNCFFETDIFPIIENSSTIWRVLSLKKN